MTSIYKAVKKNILLLAGVLCACIAAAQDKNKAQYTRIDGASDKVYLFPEFYSREIRHNKDTTWKFECYDFRDSILDIDTVGAIKEVKFFSLFKSYTDSAHTYKDSNGMPQLLPVSSIIQRYDRAGKDKWLSVDYAHNKYADLKEYPGEIVKMDTVIIYDPISRKEQMKFYKYYKVSPVK